MSYFQQNAKYMNSNIWKPVQELIFFFKQDAAEQQKKLIDQ